MKHLKYLAIVILSTLLMSTNALAAEVPTVDSDGVLIYDMDNTAATVSDRVVIETKDLQILRDTIVNYDKEVRSTWLSSFQQLGVNFNTNKVAVLSSTGLTWSDLTISNLSSGLINIPRSKLTNGSHTNIQLSQADESLSSVTIGSKSYVLQIPKGWREQVLNLDLTPIFEEGVRQGTVTELIQSGSIVFTHHVHNTSTKSDTCTSTDAVNTTKEGVSDSFTLNGDTRIYTPNISEDWYVFDHGYTPTGCYSTRHCHYHTLIGHAGSGCYTKPIQHESQWVEKHGTVNDDDGNDNYEYRCSVCGVTIWLDIDGSQGTIDDDDHKYCRSFTLGCGYDTTTCLGDTFTKNCPYYNKQVISALIEYPATASPTL